MQPYFLPYIGYFQLISSVDVFVIYDNIKYTKKGWINRNRMFNNGADLTFSLPLKNGSDSLHVVQRELASDFDRVKLLNKFRGAYARAPHFEQCYVLLEGIVQHQDSNLFRYIHHSILQVCAYLGINTKIKISSEFPTDYSLQGQEKILEICKFTGADVYINAVGGAGLYCRNDFSTRGIDLYFIRARPVKYSQFEAPFVPWLSIIDVLMFNPLSLVRDWVNENYDLI